MTTTRVDPRRRVQAIRWVAGAMAVSSFLLGGWMLVDPNGFWDMVGAPSAGASGMAVSTRVVYGAAICGEGVMLALTARWPRRHAAFLGYMVAYKAIACVALAMHLAGADPVPWGGWSVVGGWAVAGALAAAIYPWRGWDALDGSQAMAPDVDAG